MTSSSPELTGRPRSAALRRARGRRRSAGGLTPRDLRYLSSLPTAPGVRIRTRRDGFGAQYLAQMGALAWAIKNHRHFYFEPFSYLDHDEDPIAMASFTGLKSWGEPVPFRQLAHVRFIPEVLGAPRPSLFFCGKTRSILRQMYWSTPKPAQCRHDIAIHIRRGDVDTKMKTRWLSDDIYLGLIKILRSFFPELTIGLYSQGNPAAFEAFSRLGASLELNRDLRQTFHELATAPLLVPAPSCLSYAAALLSEGNVLHLANRQTRPLEHWIHSKALTKAQLYRH